jgi:hypothetical protein
MIWFVAVDLKQIQHQGKKFRWSRPNACPRCHHWRIWGHGYALRYFAGFAEALPMKCYRCPSCRCVLTARPGAYFSRIRSCIALIVELLSNLVFEKNSIKRRTCWFRSQLMDQCFLHP